MELDARAIEELKVQFDKEKDTEERIRLQLPESCRRMHGELQELSNNVEYIIKNINKSSNGRYYSV